MTDGISTERKQYYDRLQGKLKSIGKRPVPYKSNTERTDLPIYEIEIGDFKTGLRYNVDNSRIIQHIQFKKSKGDKLDPADESTQKAVEEILLTDKWYSKHAIERLAADLDSGGQIEPAIISCDGTIWNGNRRIAIMRKKFAETGDSKWSRVKCVFLPELTKKDLKKLEHRLQIAHDFKEDYDRIALLLDCRTRIVDEGWTEAELANSFRNRYDEKAIKQFIQQANLIDEYLKRVGRPNDYPSLGDKGVEFFATLQSHAEYERKKFGTDEFELGKIKTEFFAAAANPDTTYVDARNLSRILKNKDARNNYLENSEIYKNYGEYTTPKQGKGTEKAFDSDTTKAVSKNITSTFAELSASEVDTPADLAVKALKKLRDIKEGDVDSADSELLDTLTKIEERTKQLKSYLEPNV